MVLDEVYLHETKAGYDDLWMESWTLTVATTADRGGDLGLRLSWADDTVSHSAHFAEGVGRAADLSPWRVDPGLQVHERLYLLDGEGPDSLQMVDASGSPLMGEGEVSAFEAPAGLGGVWNDASDGADVSMVSFRGGARGGAVGDHR